MQPDIKSQQKQKKSPKMIKEEVSHFKGLFKTAEDAYKEDISPEEVFSQLNFKKVEHGKLDENLKRALAMNARKRWPGNPVNPEGNFLETSQLFQGEDETIIYALVSTDGKQYNWSRLKKIDNNTYQVHQMNYNALMKNIVRQLAHFEIRHTQDPQKYSIPTIDDLEISIGPKVIVENTREKTKENL